MNEARVWLKAREVLIGMCFRKRLTRPNWWQLTELGRCLGAGVEVGGSVNSEEGG